MSIEETKAGGPQTVSPARMVLPVHLEDFDGHQFERVVFAYHARTDRWISLEWFGQTGKDKGRDIVDNSKRDAIKVTLKKVVSLRTLFDSLVREGRITYCSCSNSDCPVFTMTPDAAQELTTARDDVLAAFRTAYPSFTLSAD